MKLRAQSARMEQRQRSRSPDVGASEKDLRTNLNDEESLVLPNNEMTTIANDQRKVGHYKQPGGDPLNPHNTRDIKASRSTSPVRRFLRKFNGEKDHDSCVSEKDDDASTVSGPRSRGASFSDSPGLPRQNSASRILNGGSRLHTFFRKLSRNPSKQPDSSHFRSDFSGERSVGSDGSVPDSAHSRSSITNSDGESLYEGNGARIEKDFLGIKHTLSRQTAEKINSVIYLQGSSSLVAKMELRPSDVIAKVRKKLEKKFSNKIPQRYLFCYTDRVPVDADNEHVTRVKSCQHFDGSIRILPYTKMNLNISSGLSISEDQLSKISNEAESVVRCSLRLLQAFVNNTRTSKIELPSPHEACALFCRDLARATISSSVLCQVRWRKVEEDLRQVEKVLEVFMARDDLAALMNYSSDLKHLNSSILSIQQEIMFHASVSDDHPIFFIRIPKPSHRVEAVLAILMRIPLQDICGENHDQARQQLAEYLNIQEDELIDKIKSKGSANITTAGMFKNATQKMQHESSYRPVRDRNILKSVLAPDIDSQEGLISRKATSFNSRTFGWAMKEFDNWTYDLKSTQRCFLLTGGGASGKSTFASQVVRNRPNVVVASHYCRHDEVSTTDAKVMLLSISYQLCLSFRSFGSHIVSLVSDMRATRKLLMRDHYPISSVFRDFIDGPLRSIDTKHKHRQCILIDGIDLGDDGAEEISPVLKVIRSYFVHLPPWISLFITTRPHLSVLKRLRSFNAKLVEAKEKDSLEDMNVFFFDMLTKNQYGSESSRAELARQLARQSRHNYLYAKILQQKAEIALNENSSSMFEHYLYLSFDQILEKELSVVTENLSELFWELVRLSLVSFRALNKVDIIALTECQENELEMLLEDGKTFFTVTDGTIVRFSQKLIKRWLVSRMNSKHRSSLEFANLAITKAHYDAVLHMSHRSLAKNAMRVFDRIRQIKHFSLANETTKDYILQFGFRHFMLGGMESDARSMLLDPTMLVLRATETDLILADLQNFPKEDEFIQLVYRALVLSIPAIKNDPYQIISQLVGRLKAASIKGHGNSTVQTEVHDFLCRLENNDYGFEWWCPVAPTWDQAETALVKQIKGHDGQVQGIDFHKNDKLCASASWDGEVRVWNILTTNCEAQFSGHTDAVWAVHWDHEGRKIVSGGADKSVRVWDFETRDAGLVLQGHTDCVFTVQFSPDSSLIASGSKDGTIRIWKTLTGNCNLVLFNEGFIYSVAWSPVAAKKVLCSCGTDNAVRVWDVDNGVCTVVCKGHTDWVRGVVWSVNGRNIFSCSSDHTVICWDAKSGECEQVLMGHTGGIWTIKQSKDGRYLFSGSTDKTVKIWECSTWKCDQTLKGHDGAVLCITISSDGSKFLSGSADNSLIEWDSVVERSISSLDGHSKPVWGVDVTADSSHVVSASSDHTARLWNMKTSLVERVFTGHSGPVWAAKFSRSSRYVATASSDNTSSVYRLSTGGRVCLLSHSDSVWDVIWSHDDKQVFTACRDRVVRAWNPRTGECEARYHGHTKDVKRLSISPNGLRMVSASTDGTIRVWDLSKEDFCERVIENKASGTLCLDWVDDDNFAAGCSKGSVRLWNANTGDRSMEFLPGHSRRTNDVSCSPDCKRIVSASSDKGVHIWSIENEQCERKIIANTGLGAFCVKWAADGRRIVSGGSDRSVRVWLADTGQCESVMAGETGLGIYEVSWSPCGNYVASGSRDRMVQIWDADTGECIQSFNGHTNWIHAVDWDKDGVRVLSRSDDGTARVWNVKTGECEKVHEEAIIPEGFIVGSAESTTVDLSRRSIDGNPVGIQFHKVRIHGDRCCGWVGRTVHFFKLKTVQR